MPWTPNNEYVPGVKDATTGMSFGQLEAFKGPDDQLQQLVDWKAGSPSVLRRYKTDTIARGAHMQRQFTIELRVDFADAEKLEPMKKVLQQAARHALATARLISDNPKATQVVVFADDFMTGHQEIALMEDTIQEGLTATDNTSGDGGAGELGSELMELGNGGT